MADGVHNKQWTCHKCYGVFPNGWNRHHHVRQCLRLGGCALTELVSDEIRAGSNLFPMKLCCTDLICDDTRQKLSAALRMLLKVHHAVRYPILKSALNEYEESIKDVLTAMIGICEGHTPSGCHSIKYHWPLHWWITRREFGCSADEKSLERMLGEAQKLHFKHTNSRYNIEVKLMHTLMFLIISN